MNQIDKQINQYTIELDNLKENRARECDNLSDAENNLYDVQIRLTARIITGLKRIKEEAEGKNTDNWISVKDKLPEKTCNVIVCKTNGIICHMSYHKPHGSSERRFQWFSFGKLIDQHEQVTHWMILEKPIN